MLNRFILPAYILVTLFLVSAAVTASGQRGEGQRGRGQAAAGNEPSPPHDPRDLSGTWVRRGGVLSLSNDAPPFTSEGKKRFDANKPSYGPRAIPPASSARNLEDTRPASSGREASRSGSIRECSVIATESWNSVTDRRCLPKRSCGRPERRPIRSSTRFRAKGNAAASQPTDTWKCRPGRASGLSVTVRRLPILEPATRILQPRSMRCGKDGRSRATCARAFEARQRSPSSSPRWVSSPRSASAPESRRSLV